MTRGGDTPEPTPVPVPGSLCAVYVNNDYSLCCRMTDGSYRQLNVDSNGVPVGPYDDEIGGCLFSFSPDVIPPGPPGPKPSDFDPPISFIDTYTPSQQSPIGTINCRVVAADWLPDEDVDSSYRIAILVGDIEVTDPSSSLYVGDSTPFSVANVVTQP